ncbi:hypothetical protein [Streptomyces sp. BK340]|uniref:hypothetical protein n=1 Tax=Streptomyces sp. BK340 TaxID=2572903 RepID=UPI0011A68814|nr:hypothetical protein [Streptomyces sp. BK340]TVZ75509.1 hypothetical protein FB157_1556 [Streptomyces sp. BK340]
MLLSSLETPGRPRLLGLSVAQERVENVDLVTDRTDGDLRVPLALGCQGRATLGPTQEGRAA